MANEQAVFKRANQACELCGSTDGLSMYLVPDSPDESDNSAIAVCATCQTQLTNSSAIDATHWRCLNDAMWSAVPAVQVVSWRMLKQLDGEPWALDLLDMLYLEDDILAWAKAGIDDREPTLDSNGEALQAGDTVHLVKDLTVKGANFTAKRGTPVRNIRLTQNPLHIEGKVNGQTIVIIAAYTKK